MEWPFVEFSFPSSRTVPTHVSVAPGNKTHPNFSRQNQHVFDIPTHLYFCCSISGQKIVLSMRRYGARRRTPALANAGIDAHFWGKKLRFNRLIRCFPPFRSSGDPTGKRTDNQLASLCRCPFHNRAIVHTVPTSMSEVCLN